MKTKVFCGSLAMLIAAFFISCEGPEGPTGPAGAQGIQGEQGPEGPQGVTGNANVVLYEYGSQTFTSSVNYLLTDMPREMIDESIVLAYYNPTGEDESAWYAVPGIGSTAMYVTRNFWWQTSVTPSQYTMGVRTHNHDGTSHTASKTWTKFRIFVASASSIMPGGTKKSVIDLNDHDAVCELFGLSKN
jgi:hypothetical protein